MPDSRSLPAWLLLLSLLLGVSYLTMTQSKPITKKKSGATAPFQGLCGTVIFKSGNLQPGPDRTLPKGLPVVREVLIYELTTQNQVQANGEGFYTEVKSKLVKTAKSGKDGKFCVALPVGLYSVFVREEQGLYANQFDSDNHIFPVEIRKNRKSTITFEITYAAVF